MSQNCVRALRLSRAWSQEQLAELASLSVRTIQRIENGGQASLETLSAIAAAFGIDVAELTAQVPPQSAPDEALNQRVREAKERLERESAFYRELAIWAVVNVGLAAINLLGGGSYYWFVWPLTIWGIFVAMKGVRVFLLHDWLERRQQRRLQQLLRK